MKQTKAKSGGGSKSDAVKKAPREVVQEALQVTWVLKGHLKNAQIGYIRVGALLVQVRDKKLYIALGHADLEDYADKRLQLGCSRVPSSDCRDYAECVPCRVLS
jgi:hypothetical protein